MEQRSGDHQLRDARELDGRIDQALGDTFVLLAEAFRTGAWLTLGHESWADYLATKADVASLRIPAADRPEVFGRFRDAGMSNRQIAAAVGVSSRTVDRALPAATATNVAEDDHVRPWWWLDHDPFPEVSLEYALDRYGLTGVHPVLAAFPLMRPDELQALAADSLGPNGWLRPVIVTDDGIVIDGRCRLIASVMVNKEIPLRRLGDLEQLPADFLTNHVLSYNIHRANYTEGQMAFAALRIQEWREQERALAGHPE